MLKFGGREKERMKISIAKYAEYSFVSSNEHFANYRRRVYVPSKFIYTGIAECGLSVVYILFVKSEMTRPLRRSSKYHTYVNFYTFFSLWES